MEISKIFKNFLEAEGADAPASLRLAGLDGLQRLAICQDILADINAALEGGIEDAIDGVDDADFSAAQGRLEMIAGYAARIHSAVSDAMGITAQQRQMDHLALLAEEIRELSDEERHQLMASLIQE